MFWVFSTSIFISLVLAVHSSPYLNVGCEVAEELDWIDGQHVSLLQGALQHVSIKRTDQVAVSEGMRVAGDKKSFGGEPMKELEKKMMSLQTLSPIPRANTENSPADLIQEMGMANKVRLYNYTDAVTRPAVAFGEQYNTTVVDGSLTWVHSVPGDTDMYKSRTWLVNGLSLAILAFVALSIYVGATYSDSHSQFPAWVAVTLAISAVMWCVGFFYTNANYVMVATFSTGEAHLLTMDVVTLEPGVASDNPWRLVYGLVSTPETRLCGVVCCILTIGDPIVKMTLMVGGELLRHWESTRLMARRFFIAARVISKWSSPFFILMLLMHAAFIALGRNSTLIATKASLDLGWIGYCLFSITNIISVVSIKLPEVDGGSHRPPREWSPIVNRFAAIFVLIGTISYLMMFGHAIFADAFSCGIGDPLLRAVMGPALYGQIHSSPLSIWRCLALCIQRFFNSWQVMPLMAGIVLAAFIVILPVIDICALAAVCYYARLDGPEQVRKAQKALGITRVTRHSLMTDVTIIALIALDATELMTVLGAVRALAMAESMRYFITYGIVESGLGVAEKLDKLAHDEAAAAAQKPGSTLTATKPYEDIRASKLTNITEVHMLTK